MDKNEFAIWEMSKGPSSGMLIALPERAEVPWSEPKSRVGEIDVPEEELELLTPKKDGAGVTCVQEEFGGS